MTCSKSAYQCPWSPDQLITELNTRLRALLLVVGVVLVGVGTLTIAAQLSSAARTRRAEIGLRRALGAAKRHILIQFLLEGAVLAGTGAVIGGATGLIAGVGVAATRGIPIAVGWWVFAALPGMALLGVVAAIIPAWRAAAIDPVEALRAT